MNRELAEEIKSRVSTKDFCTSVGISIDRHGSALCPFHSDRKTPSLKVYADPARGWHCFGCGQGGDVIKFAMLWYGIGFWQAIVRIDTDFGLCLPINHKYTSEDMRKSREVAQKRALKLKLDREEGERLKSRYWACFDRLLACSRIVDRYRPKNGAEFDVRWAAAVRLLPKIRYEYEQAQDALLQFKGRMGRYGTAVAEQAGGSNQAVDERGLPKHSAI